jgi:mannose-1-phosphate guanylyltransferase/mannose-1-phosphate guanylyltransferase/mannose-6-phosphate isomerase
MLIPVILCGGSGSRLWPLSRGAYPKQLLPLIDSHSLLQTSCLRAKQLSDEKIIIICNEQYRFIIAEQLSQIGIDDAVILLEPIAKNTAVAIAVAASYVNQQYQGLAEKPTLCVMPSDHHIEDVDTFQDNIKQVIPYVNDSNLTILGIKPTHASTSYGYIEYQSAITPSLFNVSSFLEKPNKTVAEQLIKQENILWNAGIFMFNANSVLEHFEKYAEDIARYAQQSLINAVIDMDFVRLDKVAYEKVEALPFDIAIMEKANNIQVGLLKTPWFDIGEWSQLAKVCPKDENQNVIQGDVITHNSSDCYINSSSRLVTVSGLSDLVVVETKDAVLVAKKSQSQDVKYLVEQLKAKQYPQAYFHQQCHRPWGTYEVLDNDDGFKVKRIIVKPGHSLSLQSHCHRSEHWIVVKGQALVVCGENEYLLNENESRYIPKNTKHRLSNTCDKLLEIIEVQVGDYLGEDDIIRYDDNYGREQHGSKQPSHSENDKIISEAL